jgi:hypothetical protein
MKISTFIPTLVAALSIAGTAQADVTNATPTIETAHCYSKLSPYVCSVEEAELAQLEAGYRLLQSDSDEAILPRQAKDGHKDAAAQPVPEPQTFVMILLGLVLLGFTSQRQEEYEKFSD